jgi:hypothetical protein
VVVTHAGEKGVVIIITRLRTTLSAVVRCCCLALERIPISPQVAGYGPRGQAARGSSQLGQLPVVARALPVSAPDAFRITGSCPKWRGPFPSFLDHLGLR